ncbi:hypothetical protein Tco_1457579 [Tanacetum coccineum]
MHGDGTIQEVIVLQRVINLIRNFNCSTVLHAIKCSKTMANFSLEYRKRRVPYHGWNCETSIAGMKVSQSVSVLISVIWIASHLRALRESLHNASALPYRIYGVCIGIMACRGLSLVSSPLHAMKSPFPNLVFRCSEFGGVTHITTMVVRPVEAGD